jgi:hypothetical protein
VAGRILADEERHVPFHVDRLRNGFAGTPAAGRAVGAASWWVLMTGAAVVVAADHGRALRDLGVSRHRFIADVLRLFRPLVRQVFGAGAWTGSCGRGGTTAYVKRSGHAGVGRSGR